MQRFRRTQYVKQVNAGMLIIAYATLLLMGCDAGQTSENVKESARQLKEGFDKIDPIAMKEIFREYTAELEKTANLEKALEAAKRELKEVEGSKAWATYSISGRQTGSAWADVYVKQGTNESHVLSLRNKSATKDAETALLTPYDLVMTHGFEAGKPASLVVRGKGDDGGHLLELTISRKIGGKFQVVSRWSPTGSSFRDIEHVWLDDLMLPEY